MTITRCFKTQVFRVAFGIILLGIMTGCADGNDAVPVVADNLSDESATSPSERVDGGLDEAQPSSDDAPDLSGDADGAPAVSPDGDGGSVDRA